MEANKPGNAIELAIAGTKQLLKTKNIIVEEFGGLTLTVHQRTAKPRNEVIKFIQRNPELSKIDQLQFHTMILSHFVTDTEGKPFVGPNAQELVGQLNDEGVQKVVDLAMDMNRLGKTEEIEGDEGNE